MKPDAHVPRPLHPPLPSLKAKASGVFGGNAANVPPGRSVQRRAMDAYHRTTMVFPRIVDHTDHRAVEAIGGDLFSEPLLFLLTGLAMERRLRDYDGEAAQQQHGGDGHQSQEKIQAGHLSAQLVEIAAGFRSCSSK
jgi:hypothetical protein